MQQAALADRRAQPAPDMVAIARRLQLVPQEIYDLIFEYTFTVDRTATNSPGAQPAVNLPYRSSGVRIDLQHQPPEQLRIPMARDIFARSYYSSTAFTFSSRLLLVAWLRSLQPEHLAYLTEARYDYNSEPTRDPDAEGDRWDNKSASLELADIWEELWTKGIVNAETNFIYIRAWDFERRCWDYWNGMPDPDEEQEEDDESDGEFSYDSAEWN